MRRKNGVRRLIPAIGLGLVLGASSAAADQLDSLRADWHEARGHGNYRPVVDRLISYRGSASFGKRAEVDYMIATGLCRIDGSEATGVRLFEHILANYLLGPARGTVEAERRDCEAASAAPTEVVFAMLPGQGGASEIRSKLYHGIAGEQAAISTEPVKVVNRIEPAVLAARLLTPAQSDVALAAAAERLKRTPLAGHFRLAATPRFLLASSAGHSETELEEVASTLERFLAFYADAYKMRRPRHFITVYLVNGVTDFRKMATALHGIEVPPYAIGYSFRDDLSMLAIVPGQAVGTLAHELFHMLVGERYGDMPPWLEEGVASLYEVSNVSAKYLPDGQVDAGPGGVPMIGGELPVRGVPNWRGCVLQRIWLQNFRGADVQRPNVAELVAMDWRAFDNLEGDELVERQAVTHATARYFALYLQDERQALFDVFADFAARDPLELKASPADDARQRLTARLGDLAQVDTAFDGWLRATIDGQDCPN